MSQTDKKTLTWTITLAAGVLACWWAFPRAFPYFSHDWQLNREEAKAIALEKLMRSS